MIKRILVIDDNTAIHDDFRKVLTATKPQNNDLNDMESLLFGEPLQQTVITNFEIDCASQGQEGVDLIKKACSDGEPYALAFVDGRMPPGWDGIETISRMWRESPETQAVLCTAYADYSWSEIRRELGETDNLLILKKPFDNVEILQMAHALTRKWEMNRDIQGRLNKLAFYDSLTGLPNRSLFLDRLTLAIDHAHRYNHIGALLFIDLDNFKQINDTLGHSSGDNLLRVVAERLLKSVRSSDTVTRAPTTEMVARLGGDEFTVILPKITRNEDGAKAAQRVSEHIAQPVNLGNSQVVVTPSIGIAIFPHDGDNVETLLKNADRAMYHAKDIGPNMFKYFEKSMNSDALKRLKMEYHLRHALQRNELYLHYQPQYDLDSGRFIALEALLRWNNSELGIVPPADFIPLAEDNGLIVSIGEWVLETACKQLKTWLNQGILIHRIAVNVSLKQITNSDFIKTVERVLAETSLEPKRLELELTESIMELDSKGVISIMHSLKDLKVQIAIDDFGTGYSCLSRLKDMPIDSLKIDRSFIKGIDNSAEDESIVTAVITMAQKMGINVIAEGVETTKQVEFLYQKKCNNVQGFLFSRPLTPQQTIDFLKRKI